MRHERRGFTLIEVLVALTVSGIVVLLAHAVFTAVTDAGRQVHAARLALDREANARRWLHAAFSSLDVGSDSAASPFEGRPDRIAFGAWLETAGGWFERRRLELRLNDGELVARLGSGEWGVVPDGSQLMLTDSVSEVEFDYLLEPGENTKWVREWISPVSAPLAVRVRVSRGRGKGEGERVVDTLLLIVGPRG